MILFGWGHNTTKNIGPTFKKKCSNCNNENYLNLSRHATWFTLFFVPVIPYSRKYLMTCPICKYGFLLNKEQIEQIKPIAEVNEMLTSKKITEREYKLKMNELSNRLTTKVEGKVIESDAIEIKHTNGVQKSCSGCKQSLVDGAQFCGHCGEKV